VAGIAFFGPETHKQEVCFLAQKRSNNQRRELEIW